MASILIINELVGLRELLGLVMEQLGYTTFQAADGIVALQIIQKHKPHLIIMDLKMRGMNARQILHQICSISPFQKVILVNTDSEYKLYQEIREIDIVASLTDSFDLYELLDEVVKHTVFYSTANSIKI